MAGTAPSVRIVSTKGPSVSGTRSSPKRGTPVASTITIAAPPAARRRYQPKASREVISLFWTIGGTVHSDQPLDPEKTKLFLVESGRQVSLRPDGRFAIGGLESGDYTLEVIVDGQKSRQYPITVPAADYDLVV